MIFGLEPRSIFDLLISFLQGFFEVAAPLGVSGPTQHTLPIEPTVLEDTDAKAPSLEFCRIKLNSKKALTSFDTYVVLDCETFARIF